MSLKEKQAATEMYLFTKLPLYLDERYTELCEGIPEDFSELNSIDDLTPLQQALCSQNVKIVLNYLNFALTLPAWKSFEDYKLTMMFLKVEDAEDRSK